MSPDWRADALPFQLQNTKPSDWYSVAHVIEHLISNQEAVSANSIGIALIFHTASWLMTPIIFAAIRKYKF